MKNKTVKRNPPRNVQPITFYRDIQFNTNLLLDFLKLNVNRAAAVTPGENHSNVFTKTSLHQNVINDIKTKHEKVSVEFNNEEIKPQIFTQ